MSFLAFNFEWSHIFIFFSGIFFGASIVCLVYLFFVLKTIRKVKDKPSKNVDEKIVSTRIENTKIAFKESKNKGNAAIVYTIDLCKKLALDTARDFYPNSKYPLLELNLDELKDLFLYINTRLDDILNHKTLKIFKRLKLSFIFSLNNTKKEIDANPIIKASKKYKVKQTFNSFKKVINVVNPFWWARNLVIDTSLNLIISKLCLISISIVGEETYRIYSKKVFNQDNLLDTGVSELVSEIDEMDGEVYGE